MKILIVDDNPTNLKLLRVTLEAEEFEITPAKDGLEAMDLLKSQPFDLLVSDILMPNLDGYQLCKEIRSHEKLKDLPIVIYTASYTSQSDEKLALDLGADKYIRKPARPADLVRAINDAYSAERRKQAAPLPENIVLKQYSERLVEKLEEKNVELYERTEELRVAHSKLRHMLVHSPAIICSFKFIGTSINLTIATDNIQRLLGLRSRDANYLWWLDSLHPNDREEAIASLCRNDLDEYLQEYRLRHIDGSYRCMESTSRLLRDAEGKPIEIIAVWTDVTERNQAQKAFRHSEEQFRSMLETVELIALIIDRNANVKFCNDYYLRLTGWERDEVVGSSWFKNIPSKTAREREAQFYTKIAEGRIESHVGATIRTKSGEVREVNWSNTILRDDSGVVVGVATIGEDVTERNLASKTLKKMNRELEKRVRERTADLQQTNVELQVAKELAEMANQAKSSFLSRMSHEFRTPMNAILGFGQVLGMTDLDEMQTDSVEQILKGGRHLLNLINDILEISRIEADPFGILLESISLSEILTESISFMKPVADTRNISLHFEGTDKAVVADSQRLRQVVLNLISNAIKYNVDEGTVTLSVLAESKDQISIQVADTGIGISKDKQDRLFTPFERLGAEGMNIEGTGLGLSLSKSMTEAMGGKLTYVPSKLGGATFRITLPKVKEVAQPIKVAGPSVTNLESNEEVSLILAIEDNIINSRLLTRIFSFRRDIELVVAREGSLGLALADTHTPRLILLDLHLPDMTGRDVLTELRSKPATKDIPVIVLTADVFSIQRETLLEAGAFRFITKPFEVADLIEAVNEGIKEGTKHVNDAKR